MCDIRYDEIDRRLLCPQCGSELFMTVAVYIHNVLYIHNVPAHKTRQEGQGAYKTPFGEVTAPFFFDDGAESGDIVLLECQECDWTWRNND